MGECPTGSPFWGSGDPQGVFHAFPRVPVVTLKKTGLSGGCYERNEMSRNRSTVGFVERCERQVNLLHKVAKIHKNISAVAASALHAGRGTPGGRTRHCGRPFRRSTPSAPCLVASFRRRLFKHIKAFGHVG